MKLFLKIFVLSMLLLSIGCGPEYLRTETNYAQASGFQIDKEAEIHNTDANREVVDLLLRYRNAMVSRNVGELKRMIGDGYYENAGTTDTTTDDYGAAELDKVFEMIANHTQSVKYEITVKALRIDGERASIDYEYRYAFQYQVDEQASWDAGTEVNRLELESQDGEWKIVSGL